MSRILSKLGNGPIIRGLKRFLFRRNRKRILGQVDFGNGDNEFYLVSYPKSGNSWVRILLANLFYDGSEEIAFHNVGEFLPDSNHASQMKEAFREGSAFGKLKIQIVKTHDEYMSFYRGKKVIYIVRDGLDVVNSYVHYQSARIPTPPSAHQIIKGVGTMPIGPWHKHVLGWKKAKGTKVLIVRYEDLLKDTESCLLDMLNFMSIKPNLAHLKECIEKSSFENLKRLETKYGYYDDKRTKSGKKVPFVREGKQHSGKKDLDSSERTYFWKIAGKAMKSFGYS